jgi:hypothetical protein
MQVNLQLSGGTVLQTLLNPQLSGVIVTTYYGTIDILYTLDSASPLVKLKPRIFQRLPPFE